MFDSIVNKYFCRKCPKNAINAIMPARWYHKLGTVATDWELKENNTKTKEQNIELSHMSCAPIFLSFK